MEEIGRSYQIPQEKGSIEKLIDTLRKDGWFIEESPSFILRLGGPMYGICRGEPSSNWRDRVYLGFIYHSEIRTCKPERQVGIIHKNELQLFLSRLDL